MDLTTAEVPVVKVTFDGYQSAQMRQEFNYAGFKSEIISCDRTLDPYQTLKLGLYETRVSLPKSNLLYSEISNLVLINGVKVDHPDTSSKDVSDAVAGCVYSAYQERKTYDTMLALEEIDEDSFLNPSDMFGVGIRSEFDLLMGSMMR